MIYKLELFNKDPQLDLRVKKNAIKEVIEFILEGGKSRRSYKSVSRIDLVDVQAKYFTIEVDETSKDWHSFVGQKLANEYNMRSFCDPKNKEKMLEFKLISGSKTDDVVMILREDIIDMTQKLLEKKKQIILYGPPGTGKTYNTKDIAIKLLGGDKKIYEKYRIECRIEFITFHPSYSYEEFMEGITVTTKGENVPTENLQYMCKSGIFKNMCKMALGSAIGLPLDEINKKTWREVYVSYLKKENKTIGFEKALKYVLIIDEINRGDISKIFGELITLLEADKRLGEENELIAKLPTSGDEFCVPPNLYIIATMNTADRSLALLDVALRRRFGFIEMSPKFEILNKHIEKKRNDENIDSETYNLLVKSIHVIEKGINIKICDKSIGRDKQIGHSFLFKVDSIHDLVLVWRYEILPLLEEYCYSDYQKINQILFDDPSDTEWISQAKGIGEIDSSNLQRMLDQIKIRNNEQH